MNRRDFAIELGLGAAGVVAGSTIHQQVLAALELPEPAPALNIIAWHERNKADHKQLLDTNAAAGFRTLSLAVYGDRDDPRYASVMIKRPHIVAQQQFLALDAAGFQKTFNDLSAKGWGPLIVSATGPTDNPLFAAVFHPITPTPETHFGLTGDQFAQLNKSIMKKGGILEWADAYGSFLDVRYIGVWYPNPDRVAWNCDAINEAPGEVQKRFNAVISVGGRPAHVALTPAFGKLELFVDSKIGDWVSRGAMTSAEYQAEFEKQTAQGYVPARLAAKGTGNNARFAAIFIKKEEIEPRGFRVSTDTPSVAAIDDAVQAVMVANQLRGASLAIINGTKLVYAKGYTWAEKNYPDVQPTTFFRQASVSKMVAAMATYQLIQEHAQVSPGHGFTLDTSMQSVLRLRAPGGGQPADPKFNYITIRHLLEMRAGVDSGLVWRDIQARDAFQSKLPANPAQLASWCAGQQLIATPGDKSKALYSNGCYFMLSQVVAQMRSAASFEAAITKSLLNPLGITRVRGSRSLIGAQAPDEARYHSNYQCLNKDCSDSLFPKLQTATSVMSQDQPIVALGYGEENLENHDGSGGLSAAATDVARLLAALNWRQGNPVLTDDTVTMMLANAAAATADNMYAKGAHGFHGFDWMGTVDAAKGLYWGYKGGYLSTSQNGIYFERGGWGYVINWNGNTPNGEAWYPTFNSVLNEAKKRDWGNTDLFKQYGMNPIA